MLVKLNLSGHQNVDLAALGFEFPGPLVVDLADPLLPVRVAEFLAPKIGSGDTVTVALPGLAPLAAIVVAVIHGLSGQFPKTQPLLRNADGTFSPGPILDLQNIRTTIARNAHRDQGTAIIL